MTKKLLIATLFVALFFSQNLVFAEYSDVDSNAKNIDAINYLTELGVVQGYQDGTFKPNNTITRAEFTKIVLLSEDKNNLDKTPNDCFDDVLKEQWFAPYVCFAKSKNIIDGYPDETFKPEQPITFVESAKILHETLSSKKLNTDANIWYEPYVEFFLENKLAPSTIKSLDQKVTRAEVAEMVYRIKNNKKDLDSTLLTLNTPKVCDTDPTNIADNIDEEKIYESWKSWLNQERTALNLTQLEYNPFLNITAKNWSETAKDRGYIDHKRDGQSSYYDYNFIQNWFKNFGVEFELINRTTYTETVGWGYVRCNTNDCTQALTDAIYTSFEFIMDEKGKTYRPHYNSLVNPNFTQIGLGISIDELTNKYYLTLHYATAVSVDENVLSCD